MEPVENQKRNNLNLSYEISIEDPVVVYNLKGKITNELEYEALEKEVFNLLNQNYYRIVFDLEGLTHTNSSGIAFFMKTLTKSRIMGGDLILIGVQGNVKKVFEIAKLDEVYTIYENLEEALNHYKALQ